MNDSQMLKDLSLICVCACVCDSSHMLMVSIVFLMVLMLALYVRVQAGSFFPLVCVPTSTQFACTQARGHSPQSIC